MTRMDLMYGTRPVKPEIAGFDCDRCKRSFMVTATGIYDRVSGELTEPCRHFKTVRREESGVWIVEINPPRTTKERILNDRRLRSLPTNRHIFERSRDPNRLPA